MLKILITIILFLIAIIGTGLFLKAKEINEKEIGKTYSDEELRRIGDKASQEALRTFLQKLSEE